MKVFLIRHGDKKKGDYFNSTLNSNDEPLSDIGINQANQLANYFNDIHIGTIYISDFVRTYQTVEPLASKKSIIINRTNLLNEIDGNDYWNTPEEERKLKYSDINLKLENRNMDFRYPNGESGKDVVGRVKKIFAIIMRNKQNTIIISHDGWIRCALCFLLGTSINNRFHFNIDTCGITEIEYFEPSEYWIIQRINHILYKR